MNYNCTLKKQIQPFKLTSNAYTLNTLILYSSSLKEIAKKLQQMTLKAPNFLLHTPVIIDLSALDKNHNPFHLKTAYDIFLNYGIIVIAIKGYTPIYEQEAKNLNIACLPQEAKETCNFNSSNAIVTVNEPIVVQKNTWKSEHYRTKYVATPVRSGQQIFSTNDLVIAGSVSTGAEILAGGNIHVYGSLRGRALAGINGDKEARIFSLRFEAEMVSIDGQYHIPSITSDTDTWSQSVLVSLHNNGLRINKI